MRSRLLALAGAMSLLGGSLLPNAALATGPTDDFTAHRAPAEMGLRRLDRATLDKLRSIRGLGPAGLRSSGSIDVIVQLAGPSVSSFEADSLARTGERLSVGHRLGIAADVAARQDQLRPRIAALGGRIAASYRFALNGLRLSIAQDRLVALARLPGVESVMPVPVVRHELLNANRYVNSPRAWALNDGLNNRLTGQGVRIAVIDTGIDYFHADFGGSGNPAHFAGDDPTNPGSAFPTAKVIAGYDLAGDDYDADGVSGSTTPTPDDDPLDCYGHGTHVAGIAAGFGVKRVGSVSSTYGGAYNATTLGSTTWRVPPGVAPRASIVALKIFGCDGSSNLVVDAIDRAVAMGGVDVINMSLGSIFARNDEAIAVAVAGATDAGIVVVGAAGNSGPSAYIHGGVTTGDAGIAVAAVNAAGTTTDPDRRYLAYFSSGGPRNGDSALKPDITAPGVDVISAEMGSGKAGVAYSGTSMATPVVAGVAALAVQAHPGWTPLEIKSALLGTAGAGKKKLRPGQYDPRLAGAGAVDAFRSADTVAFIVADDPGGASLSFGYDELAGAYSEQRTFTLVNRGTRSITYALSSQFVGPRLGASMTLSSSAVTVPAQGTVEVTATLALSTTAVRSLPGAFAPEAVANGAPSAPEIIYQDISDLAGVIKATPTRAGGHRYRLRLPFLAVPRGVSDVSLSGRTDYVVAADTASFTATLTNSGSAGNHAGPAEVYAWGLSDPQDGWEGGDLRAVGVQQFSCGTADGCAADDRLVVFAVNTWGRWSSLSTEEFDILVDVDKDSMADFAVFNADFGWRFGGDYDGTAVVLTCALDALGLCSGLYDGFQFPEGQLLNGGTTFLPTIGSWLGMSGARDKLQYTAASANVIPSTYSLTDVVTTEGGVDTAWAPWHPWLPAVNTGDTYDLAVGASIVHPFRVNLTNNGVQGSPRGWMVVSVDDASGEWQAELVPIGALP